MSSKLKKQEMLNKNGSFMIKHWQIGTPIVLTSFKGAGAKKPMKNYFFDQN